MFNSLNQIPVFDVDRITYLMRSHNGHKNHASCTNKLDNLVDNVEVARSVLKICFSNQCQWSYLITHCQPSYQTCLYN